MVLKEDHLFCKYDSIWLKFIRIYILPKDDHFFLSLSNYSTNIQFSKVRRKIVFSSVLSCRVKTCSQKRRRKKKHLEGHFWTLGFGTRHTKLVLGVFYTLLHTQINSKLIFDSRYGQPQVVICFNSPCLIRNITRYLYKLDFFKCGLPLIIKESKEVITF